MDRMLRCLAALLIAGSLAACEDGRVDVSLSADRPGSNLQKLVVTVEGISLQRDDGSEDRIDLQDPAPIDLMRYDTVAASLLDGEALDAGDYTGIRLRLRDSKTRDNYLVEANGQERELSIGDTQALAPLLFSVKKNAGKSFTLQLRMDLRSSLSSSGDQRSLTPVLRAVRSTKAASVSGSVANSIVSGSGCKRSSASTGTGVAVYAFQGHDLEPDDADAIEPNPIATAPVTGSSANGWSYRLTSLVPGDYTLALTCTGDLDDGQRDDTANNGDFKFIDDNHEINLDEAEAKDLDFRN